ncbi:MAG: hypothetical protein RIS79_2996 [Verrucomicrobiota bacterium]|jgi:hypothetical protein
MRLFSMSFSDYTPNPAKNIPSPVIDMRLRWECYVRSTLFRK